MNRIVLIIISMVLSIALGVVCMFLARKLFISKGHPAVVIVLSVFLFILGLGFFVYPIFQTSQIRAIWDNKKTYDMAVEESYVFYLNDEIVDASTINPDDYTIICNKDEGKAYATPIQ